MERRLYAAEPEPRFWQISVADSDIVIQRGPAGTPGTQHRIGCKSPADAAKTAEALVAQRLADGFRDQPPEVPAGLDELTERRLLEDDLDRWTVLADSLMETPDQRRGELISLQVQTARGVRGSLTKARKHIQTHYDALVGALGAFHKQVTIDWQFGYARTARVWMGPFGVPLAEVIPALFGSPASRFLRRLELGSPGTEGRYDPTLRALGKYDWPRHLDSLVVGAFDLDLLVESGQYELAWPRLDSLSGLLPKSGVLRELTVRAVINTLGRGPFVALERLHVHSSRLDARVVSDLLELDVPKLRALELTVGANTTLPPANVAQVFRRYLEWPGVTELGLHECAQWAEVVGGLELAKVKRVDLRTNRLGADDVARLIALAPRLGATVLDLRDNPLSLEVMARLKKELPTVVVDEPAPRKRRAAKTQGRG